LILVVPDASQHDSDLTAAQGAQDSLDRLAPHAAAGRMRDVPGDDRSAQGGSGREGCNRMIETRIDGIGGEKPANEPAAPSGESGAAPASATPPASPAPSAPPAAAPPQPGPAGGNGDAEGGALRSAYVARVTQEPPPAAGGVELPENPVVMRKVTVGTP